MKSLKLIALATLFSTGLYAQDRVKGFVYHDVNNNGRRDGKQTGISKVAVSNGVQVTLTDEKGWYKLPVGKDNGIFVIKPRGYKVPLNSDNLPKFYYLHKPQGSPATLETPDAPHKRKQSCQWPLRGDPRFRAARLRFGNVLRH